MIRLGGPGASVRGAGNDLEIVTLAQFKAYIGEGGTGADAMIQVMLDNVHMAVFNATGCRYFKQNTTQHDEVYKGQGTDKLRLQQFPIIACTFCELGYLDSGGVGFAPVWVKSESVTDLYLDAENGRAMRSTAVWADGYSYRFKYTAGYGTSPALPMPPDLMDAVCQWTGVKFARAQDRRWDQMSQGREAETTQYTLNEAPAQVRDVIESYRRVEVTIA